MTIIRRLFILAWFLIVLTTGCAPAPNNSNTTVSTTQPSPSPSASPSPTNTESASVDVTLPLLDALLTDNKFVARLKKDAKVSDEQVESIKRAASAATAGLRETNAEESDDTDGNPRERAASELRSILGEEKAKEVARVANDYWSKGDTTEGSADTVQMLKGPNAVPTDTRVVVNIPAFRMDLFRMDRS